MGTYTTNYNLFMPTIGEQGWGELVNGNFTTIDTTMKSLSDRATSLENADTAFDARLQPFEEHISFDSDGIIVGNVAGKINLYSYGTNSNNIRILTVSAPSSSVSGGTTSKSFTLNTSTVSITRCNTGIINYALNDSEFKNTLSCTCNIVVTNTGNYSKNHTVSVTCDGETVLPASTKSIYGRNGSTYYTGTWSFTRNLSKTYVINFNCAHVEWNATVSGYSETNFYVP